MRLTSARPMPAVMRQQAEAAISVATATVVYWLAASETTRSSLVQPLLVGGGIFLVFGAVGLAVMAFTIQNLDPPPLPADVRVERSPGAITLSMFFGVRLLVLTTIALSFLGSRPQEAVYLASIGLGVAPGMLGISALLHRWERIHGAELIYAGALRRKTGARSPLFRGAGDR